MFGIKAPIAFCTWSSDWTMYAAAAFMDSKRTCKIQNLGLVYLYQGSGEKKWQLTDWLSASVRLVRKTFFRVSTCWSEIKSGTEAKIRNADSRWAALGAWLHSNKALRSASHLTINTNIRIPYPAIPFVTYHLSPNPSLLLLQWYRLPCVECLDQFHWQEPSKEVPWHCFWCYPGSFPKDEHRDQQLKWTAWKQDDAKGHYSASATRIYTSIKHDYFIQTLVYLHFRVLGNKLSQSDKQ